MRECRICKQAITQSQLNLGDAFGDRHKGFFHAECVQDEMQKIREEAEREQNKQADSAV